VACSGAKYSTTKYSTTEFGKFENKDFLLKQKAIFDIFQHIHQPELYNTEWHEFKDWSFESFPDKYTNKEAFDYFYDLYKFGFLAKDEIFTVYSKPQRTQAIALFKMFYYAVDWDTFYHTMVWARFNMNQGMFVYALSVAILHREDTKGLVLPALYEIEPYFFFNDVVISKAHRYRMQGFFDVQENFEYYSAYIGTNYTDEFFKYSDEHKLAYFTEDIGLNMFYYYYNLDYPFWMDGDEFGLKKDRRGEYYMFQHQQLLARYYLERLSNGLGEIPEFSYFEPLKTGYYPAMSYYNGVHFPARENYYNAYYEKNYKTIEMIQDYEFRIRQAIDSGFVTLEDGTYLSLKDPKQVEVLGNLFQGNADSVNNRFYGYLEVFAKMVLGGSFEKYDGYTFVPSVLEHYQTALRDPMFYQLYKRIFHFYFQYKNLLPSYKFEELNYKDVEIKGVEMDKLVTYFDDFEADITNAVDVDFDDSVYKQTEFGSFGKAAQYKGKDFYIGARQPRLNHLPFEFKLEVYSKVAQKAVVYMYIGPKYDEFGKPFTYEANRFNFFQLESFPVELTVGKNFIERGSKDFTWFVADRTTYFQLYKNLMYAIKGEKEFTFGMSEAHCGFPNRLMLPKGSFEGQSFQFFFMVMPYLEPSSPKYSTFDRKFSCGIGSGSRYLDTLPFGFPFDRPIDETYWYTRNMYFYDTKIYHKY
jgi:hypothetical protein